MARLPILEENLDYTRLDLTRHYIQIDCDFTCYLVLNPSGVVPMEGTDVCVFRIGAWQIDAWTFLTDKFTKNTPGFSACLCWDKTLITDLALAPRVAESDIDTANSISSLKGQPVNITGFSLADGDSLPVYTLDGVWVNTLPYNGNQPISHNWYRLAIGEPLDKYLNSVKYEAEGSIYFYPRCVSFNRDTVWNNNGDGYQVGKCSIVDDRIFGSFAYQTVRCYDAILNRDIKDFNVELSGGVISSISVHIKGICYNSYSTSNGDFDADCSPSSVMVRF